MRNMQDEKGKPLEGFVADYLVPVAVEKNGKAYWFLEGRELPVYKYAEDIGQMISVPRELLDPAGLLKTMFPAKEFQESEEGKKLLENVKFSSTDEMILLKRILIQRLEIMRNSRNNADGRRIRYYAIKKEEGILPMAGIYRENFEQDIRFVSDRGKVRFESRGWKNKVHAVNKKTVCDPGYLQKMRLCDRIRAFTKRTKISGAGTGKFWERSKRLSSGKNEKQKHLRKKLQK